LVCRSVRKQLFGGNNKSQGMEECRHFWSVCTPTWRLSITHCCGLEKRRFLSH
jgi:hypothetical protein